MLAAAVHVFAVRVFSCVLRNLLRVACFCVSQYLCLCFCLYEYASVFCAYMYRCAFVHVAV